MVTEQGASVRMPARRFGSWRLASELVVPPRATGLVLLASGTGGLRDRHVAEVLQHHNLATLLFDLLTDAEAQDGRQRANIALLTARVVRALDWVLGPPVLANLRCGLFGTNAGAAAALAGAAERPSRVEVLVVRGGRPDLAGDVIGRVLAPTLLLAGGSDPPALDAHRVALGLLHCEKRLEVVPNADHLFEQPGALDGMAEMAAQWFAQHLRPRTAS